jgi:hypothetical protein
MGRKSLHGRVPNVLGRFHGSRATFKLATDISLLPKDPMQPPQNVDFFTHIVRYGRIVTVETPKSVLSKLYRNDALQGTTAGMKRLQGF